MRWTVGLLVVVSGCTGTGTGTEPAAAPATTERPRPTVETDATEAVGDGDVASWSVVAVVDGDTLRVEGPGGEERVRLIGVNTPEEGECFSDEATDALRELVAGGEVRLVRDVSDRDRFDRLLRYVETLDGVDVNAELIRSGAARSQRYEPDVSRSDRYDELQAAAQEEGRGRWAPDACGAPTAADVRVDVDVRYDAPGDDDVNLNGEWVRFTNRGADPLDLTGWQVADESSSHRYRFESLVLAPGGSVTLYTGCGTDSTSERYWCSEGSAVWNNSGDTVSLQDQLGNTVLTESYRP